jgi:hypothetical protein
MTDKLPRLHPRPVPRFAAYDLQVRDRPNADLSAFISLSASLTGFSEAELSSTGMTNAYYEELGQTVGIPIRNAFLNSNSDPSELMASSLYGPLARNVIRMWYLGQWKRLPPDWVDRLSPDQLTGFDEFGRNADRILSAEAYQEGLAWVAIAANPMGAKQPGFGTWSEPP